MVVTLNGVKYNCPGKEDITTEHFQRIYTLWGDELQKEAHDRDYFALFYILTGSEFRKFKPSKDNQEAIWVAVKWIFDKFDETGDMFSFDDRTFKTPRISNLSIGQNMIIRRHMEKTRWLQENISFALAVWVQSQIDGSFNIDRIDEIEKNISQMPANKTHGIGFFLSVNAMNFGQPSISGWSQIKNSLKQTIREMFPSLQRLRGFTVFETPLY